MQSGIFPEAIGVLHEHTVWWKSERSFVEKERSFVEKALSCWMENVEAFKSTN